MELLTLGLFCAALLACVLLDLSVLWALAAGLLLFLLYGRRRGFSRRELVKMALTGVITIRNILLTFLLIGLLTAVWRASGTIPVLVCDAARLIRPAIFLPMTFLLNCALSVLTGTAFGTAATMGVICATMGAAMGADPVLTGGAVLSGVFFGDRCSPVSTSALLVSEITGTNLFGNLKRMLRTALVPFLAACAVYALLGLRMETAGEAPDLTEIFGRVFSLHWTALLPAAVVLALSLLQVNVKCTLAAGVLTAIPICLLVQHVPAGELLRQAVFGYTAPDPAAAQMLDGGGILSMVRSAAIIAISAAYSDIFRRTGLLDGVKDQIGRLSRRSTPYTAVLCAAAGSCVIACNQTLAILLTHQLCGELTDDREELALWLADSAVVAAPLVPWSIACAVPLTSIGAPMSAALLACYLYLLPLWRLVLSFVRKRR